MTTPDRTVNVFVEVRDAVRFRGAVMALEHPTSRHGSYGQVAEAAGVSKSFVAQLANGAKRRVALETAVKVAAALGKPVGDLFVLPEADRLRDLGLVAA